MRNLTQSELLSLNQLLTMEVYGLAVARAVGKTVSDEKLQDLVQDGMDTSEARIRTIQQFLNENQIVQGGTQ